MTYYNTAPQIYQQIPQVAVQQQVAAPTAGPSTSSSFNIENISQVKEFKPIGKTAENSVGGFPAFTNQLPQSSALPAQSQNQDNSNPSNWFQKGQQNNFVRQDFIVPNAVSLNLKAEEFVFTKKPAPAPAPAQAPSPAPTAAPAQAPVQVEAPAPVQIDPITKKLRDDLKVPEDQLKSLKELLDKIAVATKASDAEGRIQLLRDLRTSYLCTVNNAVPSAYWAGQIDRKPTDFVPMKQSNFQKGGYP